MMKPFYLELLLHVIEFWHFKEHTYSNPIQDRIDSTENVQIVVGIPMNLNVHNRMIPHLDTCPLGISMRPGSTVEARRVYTT